MTKKLSRFDTPALSSVDSDRLRPIALSRLLEQNRQAEPPRITAATLQSDTGLVPVRPSIDRLPWRVIAARLRARAAAARLGVWGVLSIVVITSGWPAAATAQTAGAIAIRAITMSTSGPRGSTVIVTIEGTSTLPLPTSGAADDPPRIFFDFPGVTLRAPAVIASTDPRIRRIRSAVNSVRPLVTRVGTRSRRAAAVPCGEWTWPRQGGRWRSGKCTSSRNSTRAVAAGTGETGTGLP